MPDLLRRPLVRAFSLSFSLSVIPFTAAADIVFAAKVAGPVSNIYALDDSGELHRLTDNISWRDIQPDISASGDLVFSSNREPEAGVDLERRSENFNIYLVAAGEKPRAIASSEHQDLEPQFAPGGNRVAFISRSQNSVRLGLVNRDGSQRRELLRADDILDYAWSPDGNRIALAVRRGGEFLLGTLPVTSGDGPAAEIEVLMASAGRPPVAISWSPDSRHLAYVRHPLEGGNRTLWLRNLETGRERRISADGVEVQAAPEWSRDGRRLLYSGLVDYRFYYDEQTHRKVYRGGMQLFSADMQGKNRQLTDGEALHRAPVFYPGEDRIAFLYGDALDARSLVLASMDLDSGEVRRLYDGVAQRSELRWR
ncbi:TolB family protein [Microbulbifer litoralis]|uniref:TolB family protein n=1 Tax=Microbulbifer litoralis TaxID=2933965 RepID=UPI00202921A8|nr:hypothetical protein [Microbulbifer sp. GX H0434]